MSVRAACSLDPHRYDARRLPIPGAPALFFPACLPPRQGDDLLARLIRDIPWRRDILVFGGRKVAVPRLQAWFGDPGSRYRYSGLTLRPAPWTDDLLYLKDCVETLAGVSFNAVLLNYYRDGNDSVSWHSDDERELGPDPIVASLSLGATRRFELKSREEKQRTRFSWDLTHASLLVMGGGFQRQWSHRVPKQPEVTAARVNLTFRRIF